MTIDNSNGLYYVTKSHDQCMELLVREGLELISDTGGCNATWDRILCWPMTHAGAVVERRCPQMLGMTPHKFVVRECHESGYWADQHGGPDTTGNGYTQFLEHCMPGVDTMVEYECGFRAATLARQIEYFGFSISIITLFVACMIFINFRRLRVFRTQLHLHLMLSLLIMFVIRLSLAFDQALSPDSSDVDTNKKMKGLLLHPNPVVCALLYVLLEYTKCVAFTWMYLEGFYLHNTLVFTVFTEPPTIKRYLGIAWGVPVINIAIWLIFLVYEKTGHDMGCLASYYLAWSYWVLEAPRLIQLLLNFFFIVNVIRVLWVKVRETHAAGENEGMKKSVRAAFMLIPLLGGPTFIDTVITTTPNCTWFFTIWVTFATMVYTCQGFMIAMLYCFMNKEVMNVLKTSYDRYRLQHASGETLRRGSRGTVLHQGVHKASGNQLNTPIVNNKFSTDKARTGSLAVSRIFHPKSWLNGGDRSARDETAQIHRTSTNRKSAPNIMQNGVRTSDDTPLTERLVEEETHPVTMRSEGGHSFEPIDDVTYSIAVQL